MLASNGREETLLFYFETFKHANPQAPKIIMTDHHLAQISAVQSTWPLARILLCWWHVLHAWQQHFSTTAFPELWNWLLKWIHIEDEEEFTQMWQYIQTTIPPSFIQYMKKEWLSGK
jgi:MULE transposase domain